MDDPFQAPHRPLSRPGHQGLQRRHRRQRVGREIPESGAGWAGPDPDGSPRAGTPGPRTARAFGSGPSLSPVARTEYRPVEMGIGIWEARLLSSLFGDAGSPGGSPHGYARLSAGISNGPNGCKARDSNDMEVTPCSSRRPRPPLRAGPPPLDGDRGPVDDPASRSPSRSSPSPRPRPPRRSSPRPC